MTTRAAAHARRALRAGAWNCNNKAHPSTTNPEAARGDMGTQGESAHAGSPLAIKRTPNAQPSSPTAPTAAAATPPKTAASSHFSAVLRRLNEPPVKPANLVNGLPLLKPGLYSDAALGVAEPGIAVLSGEMPLTVLASKIRYEARPTAGQVLGRCLGNCVSEAGASTSCECRPQTMKKIVDIDQNAEP